MRFVSFLYDKNLLSQGTIIFTRVNKSTLKFLRDKAAAVKVSLLSVMSETRGNRNVADENMELMLKTCFSIHVLKHQKVLIGSTLKTDLRIFRLKDTE